ncbi:LytTR family DNA-binding domain-containing protein [Sediminibacterium sp. KACHI17]|jgi:two-component system, LytTR family, response regulator
MYRCLIADDNIIERDLLFMHLSSIEKIKVVAICSSGEEALKYLKESTVDIVLSDIDMPGISGIGLMKELKKHPVFIFISSYTEYAAESYNLDAVDYIVKPASLERVQKSIDKAIEYIEIKNRVHIDTDRLTSGQELHEIGSHISTDGFFFIRENNNYTKLNIQEITFIESMGDFSRIHTIGQKKFVVLVNLKNIEKQLSQKIFKRIHRQFIINILHANTINGNEIVLDDKNVIPLSVSYRQNLVESVLEKKLLKRFGD